MTTEEQDEVKLAEEMAELLRGGWSVAQAARYHCLTESRVLQLLASVEGDGWTCSRCEGTHTPRVPCPWDGKVAK